ncbi:MAG: S-layer homology domain-containing protein [Vampirovibrio sp.]|nr:S-layer homology domain-containing protein [Vampirovibrio sp.]
MMQQLFFGATQKAVFVGLVAVSVSVGSAFAQSQYDLDSEAKLMLRAPAIKKTLQPVITQAAESAVKQTVKSVEDSTVKVIKTPIKPVTSRIPEGPPRLIPVKPEPKAVEAVQPKKNEAAAKQAVQEKTEKEQLVKNAPNVEKPAVEKTSKTSQVQVTPAAAASQKADKPVEKPIEKSVEQVQAPQKPATDFVSFCANDPVACVVQSKLMTVFPDGEFHPEYRITRSELAVMLDKAFDLPKRMTDETVAVGQISDLAQDHWAYPAIERVLALDIMEGYREGRFYPEQKITRAEAIAIFAQAYGVFQFKPETVDEVLAPITDRDRIPGWAEKAVATAVHEGFVNTEPVPEGVSASTKTGVADVSAADGKTNKPQRLYPREMMTRRDMAYMLAQLVGRRHRVSPMTGL